MVVTFGGGKVVKIIVAEEVGGEFFQLESWGYKMGPEFT